MHKMKQLDKESIFLSVPGKVPEAYTKTIEEMQRRKAFSIALERMYMSIQRVVKTERKIRNEFNGKFGDYLPFTTATELNIMPIQIIFCQAESETSQKYQFINKIEIEKQEILTKLKEICSKVFKDIPFSFPELVSAAAPMPSLARSDI